MRSRLVRAAIVACLALVATGCTKTLKIDELQTQLATQLNSQLNTTGIIVGCPSKVKAETGGTFNCTATLPNGDTVTIRVTQSDDQGHVTWRLVGASSPTPSP